MEFPIKPKNERFNRAIEKINGFINSEYMIAVIAALTLIANLFGLELYVYVVFALISYYLCVFGKDMRLVGPMLAFIYVSPSFWNNPFKNKGSIYFPGQGLEFILAMGTLYFVLLLVRIGFGEGFSHFFKSKRKLLWGFAALLAVFLLGGVGYKDYETDNITFALALFISFFLPYFVLTAMVDWKDVKKDYFAWSLLAVGFTVAIELLAVYVIQGEVTTNRNLLFTGWGTYTSMSAMILLCLPACYYLAIKKNRGYIFNILGNVLTLMLVLTQCRWSIFVGGLVYAACAVLLLIFNKKDRKVNFIIYAVAVFAAVAALYFSETLWYNVKKVATVGNSMRNEIYKDAIDRFLKNPIFGQGFYACKISPYDNPAGAAFIPCFWHNTILQMLAGCGAIGLIAYGFHRVQTVLLVVKKPNMEKIFLSIVVLSILVACLIDCHIFNIGVTLVYSVLMAFLEKVDEMKE